jgi:hypothetical protein
MHRRFMRDRVHANAERRRLIDFAGDRLSQRNF